jgi:ribokinase
MTPHLVIVGSLNMDLVIRAPRHPEPGETLTGSAFLTIPGGKGANQAVAAARLGAAVTMIGKVGQDAFGDALRANLANAGVNVEHVTRSPEATGVALITVSAAGENTIVLAPGANGTVTPEDVQTCADIIGQADALLLQLEVPLPAVLVAAEMAARRGVPVILNPAPAQPLPPDLLRHITYLIPNEHEAALLAGGPADDAEALARRVQALGPRAVVVTLGAAGALVLDGDMAAHVPSFPVTVVDSTAAGDAFVAAFAVALSEGQAPAAAATWGCAAGALACTVLGAQPSLPRRAAVAELMGEEE